MNTPLLDELSVLPGADVAPSRGAESSTPTNAGSRSVLTSKLINRVDDDRVLRRARTSDWVLVDEAERDLILALANQAAAANAATAR